MTTLRLHGLESGESACVVYRMSNGDRESKSTPPTHPVRSRVVKEGECGCVCLCVCVSVCLCEIRDSQQRLTYHASYGHFPDDAFYSDDEHERHIQRGGDDAAEDMDDPSYSFTREDS